MESFGDMTIIETYDMETVMYTGTRSRPVTSDEGCLERRAISRRCVHLGCRLVLARNGIRQNKDS